MTKRKKIWIVVADGAKASVYQREDQAEPISGVAHLTSSDSRLRDGEIMADKPGRNTGSEGVGRHGFEPRTDAHRHEEQEFARTVADYLGSHADKAGVDGIVLIAAPHMLGDLRDLMADGLKHKVTKEVAKDLTHLDEFQLEDHLRQHEGV